MVSNSYYKNILMLDSFCTWTLIKISLVYVLRRNSTLFSYFVMSLKFMLLFNGLSFPEVKEPPRYRLKPQVSFSQKSLNNRSPHNIEL